MSNLATIVNNILADSGIDDINVVVTTGSYTNPAWIVSLPWTKITGTPTTLAGYGITDAYTQTQVNNLLAGYLPLTGGTLTGPLVGTSASFTGNVTLNTSITFGSVTVGNSFFTTDSKFQHIRISVESDLAIIRTDWFSGGGGAQRDLSLQYGLQERIRLNSAGISVTGAATFNSNINTTNGSVTIKTAAFGGLLNLQSGATIDNWQLYHYTIDNTLRFNYNGAGGDEFVLTTAGNASVSGTFTASSIIRAGGTSSQYLMADGSVSTLANPVTGTGSAGQVAYWSSASAITGESNLFWDSINDRLGINTATPSSRLEVFDGDVSVTTLGSFSFFNNNRNFIPNTSGVSLGAYRYRGYSTGTTYQVGAGIWAFSSAAWSSTSTPAYLSFQTTSAGTTSPSEKMILDSLGNLGLFGSGILPVNKLQIGSLGSTGYSGNDIAIGNGTQVMAFSQTPAYSAWYTNTNFVLFPAGSGGIGNLLVGLISDNGARLQVGGNGTFSGSITADRIAIAGTVDVNARLVIGEDSSTTNVGFIRLRGHDVYEGNIYKTATYGIYMDTDSNLRPIRIDGSAFITGITGNVGIGTSSIQAGVKLDVNGATAVAGGSEGLRIGNVGDNTAYDNVKLWYTGFSGGSPRVYLTPRTTPGSGIINTFLHLTNSNGGSTTSNNTMGLIVDGSGQFGASTSGNGNVIISSAGACVMDLLNAQSEAYIRTTTYHDLYFRTNNINRMLISKDGNVGININTPQDRLHVNGAIQVGFVDVLNSALRIFWNGASSYGAIQTSSSSNLALNPFGNNVLIGTTTDIGFKLFVSGNTYSSTLGTGPSGLNVSGYGFLSQTLSGQMTILGHNVIASNSVNNQVNIVNGGWISSMIKQYYNDGITFHTDTTMYSAGAVYPMAATERMRIDSFGAITMATLAGSGNRIVVANSSGRLISAVIGSGLAFDGTTLTATGGSSGSISGSGTSGFVPVFSGTSSISNSIIQATSAKIQVVSNTNGPILEIARASGAYYWKLGMTSGSVFAIYNNGDTSMLELDPSSANMTLGSGQNVKIRLGRNTSDWGEVEYTGGVTTLRNGWDNTSAYVQQLVNGQSTRLYGSGILDQNRTSEGTHYRFQVNGDNRMILGTDGSSNALIRTGNGVDLRLGVNEDAITIKNGGNVIVGGTTNSGFKFDVQGSAYINGDFRVQGIYRDYQGEALMQTNTSAVTLIGSAGASTARSLQFLAGNSTRLTIASSGAATFTSSVTASSFFESSDLRLKSDIMDLNVDMSSILAKKYIKDGKEEVGYIAQDVETILSSAVSKREDGYLDLSYRQIHTAKIAYLEKRITELEQQLKNK